MSKGKVVLAYSGGLDTSVAIKWLQEKYDYDVVAVALDVGEGGDLDFIKAKALKIGAVSSYVIDAREEFANEFALPALQANAMYESKYPLSAALSRPLISKKLVEIAEQEGANAVAHGCTGKGNDQVRFDVSVAALNPDLEIIAPVREWAMSRDEQIQYALERDIPVPITKEKPYSIDANLWGRSCECGVLEDPWAEAPEGAFDWTKPISETPDEAQMIEIEFEQGVPVALDGEKMPLYQLILKLNAIAGEHGVGRVDHVENRLIGIKSREVYEAPAAMILIQAHKEIEFLTLPKEVIQFKPTIERRYAEIIYDGLWFSPIRQMLDGFLKESQKTVSGTARVRLHKGSSFVVGRKSENSLYNLDLATYTPEDTFKHDAAVGFITLWGLPTRVYATVNKGKK